MTDRYAVIGHPVAHSQSPRIHAMFARQTGQDLSYQALLAPLDAFTACVQDFISAGGRGANVTVPFKEQACHVATRLSERARMAGAVNTLLFDANGIFGDNTDGAGLVRDLHHNLGRAIAGTRILLLGAGGAARGVVLPLLLEHPAQLLIANRSAPKAQILADLFARALADLPAPLAAGQFPPRPQGCGLTDLAGRRFDLVINATSTGLDDTSLDIPGSVFAPDCLAYEMVYGKQTPFMAQARGAAAQVSDGLGMLVEQAAAAFLLWRGVQPDTAAVLKALRGT
ncbi:MAG: shikimate dehydrogenase [Proteobacteria bacterium]|nr:shikimate dehydrogenase [Pseudomonadota bacterium]